MNEISKLIGIGDRDVALMIFYALDPSGKTHRIAIFPQTIQLVSGECQKIEEQVSYPQFRPADQDLYVFLELLAAFSIVCLAILGDRDEFGNGLEGEELGEGIGKPLEVFLLTFD